MKPLKLAGLALSALTLAAGTAHAATNVFSNTSGNLWNTAANWSDGLPDTNDDLQIGAGLTAESATTTPATSTGSLSLLAGSTVLITGTAGSSAMFNTASSIDLYAGSTISYSNSAENTTFKALNLIGNATITSGGNTTNSRTRTFDGGISGAGALTISGRNLQTFNVTTANSSFSGGFNFTAQDRYTANFNVAGAGGTGNVTVTGIPSGGSINRSVVINLGASDVFGDNAVFTATNAKGYAGSAGGLFGGTNYFMNMNSFNDTIASLNYDGVQQANGKYTGSAATAALDPTINLVTYLGGTGVLTIVPEPASALLGGLGFLLLLRRRRA